MIYDTPDVIRWHQCISGFTQTERRCHGVLKLSEKLHACGYNNHVSRVSLRPWNSDWSETAEHIWLIGQHHRAEVVVNIYAYSWGVGWGAVKLCRELKKRGVMVNALVSADGVYRHPLLCLRWLSLLKRDRTFAPVIRIPSNVREVICFHQSLNQPQGHRIVGDEDFSGIIRPSVEINATHQYVDDSDHFHSAAMHAAERLRRLT